MRSPQSASVLIKRYDAQRLYDVDLRRYIVLDELYAWQLMAVPFVVQDAKSGEDVTAAVLAGPGGPTSRLDPNDGAPIY
jgi:polyhydroxyalkanoate synthesis regulator protein